MFLMAQIVTLGDGATGHLDAPEDDEGSNEPLVWLKCSLLTGYTQVEVLEALEMWSRVNTVCLSDTRLQGGLCAYSLLMIFRECFVQELPLLQLLVEVNKFSTAAHAAAVALLPISRIDKAVEPTRKLHAARSAVALAKQVLPALEKITKAAFYKVRLATPMLQRSAFLQWARAWAHGTSLKKCSAESAVLCGTAAGLTPPPPGTPAGGVAHVGCRGVRRQVRRARRRVHRG